MNGSLLTPPSPRAASASPLPPSPSPSPPSPSLLPLSPHPPPLPPLVAAPPPAHPPSVSDTPTPSPSPCLSWTEFCELHARVAAGDFARHFRAFLLENPHYPPDSAAAFCRRFTDRFVRHFQSELEGALAPSCAAGRDDLGSWAPQSDATSLEEEAVSPLSLSGGDAARPPEQRACDSFADSYGHCQALPPSSSSSCCSSVGGANGRREERGATLASGNGEVPVEEEEEDEEEEEEDSWLGEASVGGGLEPALESAGSAHSPPLPPSSLAVTPPPGSKEPPSSSKHKLKKRFSLRSVGRSVRGSVRGILHWRSSSSDSAHSPLPSSYSYTLGVQDAAAAPKRNAATQPPTPTSALPVSLSMPLSLPHSSSSSSSAASLAVAEAGRDLRRSNGEDKDKWSHRLEKLRLTRSPPPVLTPAAAVSSIHAAALPPTGAAGPPRKGRLVREGAVCVSSSTDDLGAAHGFPGFSFGLLHHSLDTSGAMGGAGPPTGPAHTPGAAGNAPFRGGRWHKCRLVLRGRDREGNDHGEEYYLEFFIPPKVSLLGCSGSGWGQRSHEAVCGPGLQAAAHRPLLLHPGREEHHGAGGPGQGEHLPAAGRRGPSPSPHT